MLSSFFYLTSESIIPTLLRLLIILVFSCLWIIFPKKSTTAQRWHRFLGLAAVLLAADLTVLFSLMVTPAVSGMTVVWIWFFAPMVSLGAALIIRFLIKIMAEKSEENEDDAKGAETKPNFGLMLRIFLVTEAVNFLVLCMIGASSCAKTSIGKFTLKESKTHFAQFEQSLLAVAEAHGLELKTDSIRDDRECLNITYVLKVDRNSDIEISVSNHLPDIFDFDGMGEESFNIDYTLRSPAAEFDLSLFAALANCVSGCSITSEWCENFLHESELSLPGNDAYIKTRYVQPADKSTIISRLPVNAFEQSEYYSEYDDYYAELEFYGVTGSEWWDWKLF